MLYIVLYIPFFVLMSNCQFVRYDHHHYRKKKQSNDRNLVNLEKTSEISPIKDEFLYSYSKENF